MGDGDKGSPWQVGAAVTILVALIGAYATIHASRSRSPEPAPVEPKPSVEDVRPVQVLEPAKNLSDLYEPQLKNTIDLACAAEIQAFRELDPNPLYQVFKGAALKMQIANIDFFRKNGVFAIVQRNQISYGNIKVSDEHHARVHVTPVWATTFLGIQNHLCMGRWPARELPQTVDLESTDNGWIITAVVMDDDRPPTLQPCG